MEGKRNCPSLLWTRLCALYSSVHLTVEKMASICALLMVDVSNIGKKRTCLKFIDAKEEHVFVVTERHEQSSSETCTAPVSKQLLAIDFLQLSISFFAASITHVVLSPARVDAS